MNFFTLVFAGQNMSLSWLNIMNGVIEHGERKGEKVSCFKKSW